MWGKKISHYWLKMGLPMSGSGPAFEKIKNLMG